MRLVPKKKKSLSSAVVLISNQKLKTGFVFLQKNSWIKLLINFQYAEMAELADALDLGSRN